MCGLLIVGNNEKDSKLQNNGVAPQQVVPTRIQIKKENYLGKLFATFSFTPCRIYSILDYCCQYHKASTNSKYMETVSTILQYFYSSIRNKQYKQTVRMVVSTVWLQRSQLPTNEGIWKLDGAGHKVSP